MFKKIALSVCALLTTGLVATSALAMGGFDLSADVGYATRYIWRGYDLSSENGEAIQPSASVGYAITDALSVSGNVWASYGMAKPGSGEWDEIDYTVDVSWAATDSFSVSVGHIYYTFPEVNDSDNDDTKEVYAAISKGLGPVSLDLSVYYDYDNGKGIYANCGVGYGADLAENVGFSLGANVGYMNYTEDDPDTAYYTDEDGDAFKGFSDANLSAGVSVDLGKGFALDTSVTYTITLDDVINEDNEFWGITTLAYSF